MNAGKQVLGHVRGNSTAGTITPGDHDPEDPFNTGSAFNTPQHGRAITAAMTPDSVNRRGIASMMLSSPASSSPGSEKHNTSGRQRGVIIGTSSFNATPNLIHINRSLQSSPIMRNMQTPSPGSLGLSRGHSVQGRAQSFQELDANHQRAQFTAHLQATYLAGIDPALRPQGRRMTAPTSHPRTANVEPGSEATSSRRVKGSSNTSAGRRKRRDSDSDSEYFPSPAKKAQR